MYHILFIYVSIGIVLNSRKTQMFEYSSSTYVKCIIYFLYTIATGVVFFSRNVFFHKVPIEVWILVMYHIIKTMARKLCCSISNFNVCHLSFFHNIDLPIEVWIKFIYHIIKTMARKLCSSLSNFFFVFCPFSAFMQVCQYFFLRLLKAYMKWYKMPIFNVWVVRCKGAVAIRNNDWWSQMVTKALTLLGTISLRCSWYTCVDQIVLFKIQEYFLFVTFCSRGLHICPGGRVFQRGWLKCECDLFVSKDRIYITTKCSGCLRLHIYMFKRFSL